MTDKKPDIYDVACPLPITDYPVVTLAHGGGGRLMHQLIETLIGRAFAGMAPGEQHDSAVLEPPAGQRLAFTSDSFVVRPAFFPGGSIGALAVNGTVNDLAMAGAVPRWLSCSLILEEGLAMADLWRVLQDMRSAAEAAQVAIVTGDTKVVDKGKGDGLYINTAGVGFVPAGRVVAPSRVAAGDAILVNGDLGRHGMAIMAVREGLAFESAIATDCAPLTGAVEALFTAGVDVHCLRDLTRGGLSSCLNEIAWAGKLELEVREKAVPVREDVKAACEILGFDPLYVANEGRFAAFVPAAQAEAALAVLRALPGFEQAALIGTVKGADAKGRVQLTSRVGVARVLDMISGEQLPRIC
jgi:hydrogenase expression/formation protein HypE